MVEEYDPLNAAIISGDAELATKLTQEALDAGASPLDIVDNGMVIAMDEVGRRFSAGEFYIPEMLIAARAMQHALRLLKPHLASSRVSSRGVVALGTVQGDLHDIGKNLVGMLLEGAGFQVVDLGVDVPASRFVDALRDKKADVLAMSALLTTTMPQMRDTVEALTEAGLRGQVRVIVGGAPLTQAYAHKIGADAYAPDAASAVEVVRQLLGRC